MPLPLNRVGANPGTSRCSFGLPAILPAAQLYNQFVHFAYDGINRRVDRPQNGRLDASGRHAEARKNPARDKQGSYFQRGGYQLRRVSKPGSGRCRDAPSTGWSPGYLYSGQVALGAIIDGVSYLRTILRPSSIGPKVRDPMRMLEHYATSPLLSLVVLSAAPRVIAG